jgi:2-polyprenyl-3-methyl-5-hydroxy-6-metoxy-1,4-benzoquinol methylase
MTTMTASQIPATGAGSLEPIESELRSALQACAEELLDTSRTVHVLDAGCGHRMPIPLAADLHVTGIDVVASQLRPDLDEAIVGDLQTYDLGTDRFDAVICWNVLEHVTDPLLVIRKFGAALKPGGIVILGMPHVASVKGLVTKYSPQWFHAWVWRRLLDAGPDHDEFPTVLSWSLRPAELQRFARANGLSVEFLTEYESWTQKKVRRKLHLRGRAFTWLTRLVSALSLGRVNISYTDMMIVLRRPELADTRPADA